MSVLIAIIESGHRKFYKNGRVLGTQRFKCHQCSKTFGMKTNTLFHGTRKPLSVWSRYIDLLFEQKSMREIAKELDLAITTAFFWRHKILMCLRTIVRHKNLVMEGIVEADETYTILSFKGQKRGPDRPAKKRGTAASQRGISKEQVCALVATDRRKTSRMKASVKNMALITKKSQVIGMLGVIFIYRQSISQFTSQSFEVMS